MALAASARCNAAAALALIGTAALSAEQHTYQPFEHVMQEKHVPCHHVYACDAVTLPCMSRPIMVIALVCPTIAAVCASSDDFMDASPSTRP